MTSTPPSLRTALVLRTTEDACTAAAGDAPESHPESHHPESQPEVLAYASAFPRPRVERVSPGHLVAVAAGPDGADLVVWRWYDAVVLERTHDSVRLWEPAHGEVVATARDPQRLPRPGGRAYLSAGLSGAQWWVSGPAVDRAQDADVELAEVQRFFTDLGLWDRLA